MPLIESFESASQRTLSEEFLRTGYVIRPVENREGLDQLRREVTALVCRHLGRPMPEDIDRFLNEVHNVVPVPKLNELRLAAYRGMNGWPWFRPTYFSLARQTVESLVGNELAMQNLVNLSIQFPNDDSSLLGIHADVFGGETPFEVVEWLPLVDCRGTKSMFILPHDKTKAIMPRLSQLGSRGMAELYDEVEPDLIWLDIPYGSVLVFTPNCLHGNVVNREPGTRWSMNCRFTGLFTPYMSDEKKIGSFYLPITTRVVSRIGMAYRHPEGFKE